MSVLAITVAASVLAAVGGEFATGGMRLQTALTRVIAVYAAIGALVLAYVGARDGEAAVAFAVWWTGLFLSWFGVRSHLESSILLRMIHLLGRGPTTAPALHSAYEQDYGPHQRIEELVRAGLIRRADDRVEVTRKGRLVIWMSARLGAFQPEGAS
jgi:hypothetical protein